MKPLYTTEEFNLAKADDNLLCECYSCSTPFKALKKFIQLNINGFKTKRNNYKNSCKYCSKECLFKALKTKINVVCLNCNNHFEKHLNQIKTSPNHFCSRSCSATYNNKHKTHGTRRSKLEAYLEATLTTLYPTTEFHFNRKDAIGSELDIYIPSLRLAFELNGIFHCEPVFGQDKLNQIQANDDAKFKACYDNNITLCMIDTSKQKYFKESTSKEFLDIILYHINFIGLVKNLANSC